MSIVVLLMFGMVYMKVEGGSFAEQERFRIEEGQCIG